MGSASLDKHNLAGASAPTKDATVFSMVFASATYAFFMWVFISLIFWSGSLAVQADGLLPQAIKQMFPWTIDTVSQPLSSAAANRLTVGILLNNLCPMVGFFAQHMIMARLPFKKLVTTHLYPEPIERSVFVLATSTILHLLVTTWRPIPGTVWDTPPPLRPLVWAGFFAGWTLVFISTLMFDHLELFGISQGFGLKSPPPGFRTPLVYQWIRHPMMTGFAVAFWSAPTMTYGRLLFALLSTVFIIVDVKFLEERDLKHAFPEYNDYCDKVGYYRAGPPISVVFMASAAWFVHHSGWWCSSIGWNDTKGLCPKREDQKIPLDIQVVNHNVKLAKLSAAVVRHFTAEGLTGKQVWTKVLCTLATANMDVVPPGDKFNAVKDLILPACAPGFTSSSPCWMEDVRFILNYPRGEWFSKAEGMKGHPFIRWQDTVEVTVKVEGGPAVCHDFQCNIIDFPPGADPTSPHNSHQGAAGDDKSAAHKLGHTIGTPAQPIVLKGVAIAYVPDPQGKVDATDPREDTHSFSTQNLTWSPLCPLSKPEAWPTDGTSQPPPS